MSERTVRAPAKINLHLGVGAPREDGFHPLVTVYQAVGLHDDVTVREADDWSVEVAVADWMAGVELPPVEDNIVTRAADLLAAHHGVPRRGAVHVAKAIPVAGGMAGGSADAAAALVALDRLWGTGTTDEDLLALAAELGSDVPFALVGGTALGTGRGELVERVPDAGTWWWVAVPAHAGLSTPAVYRHFDVMVPDASAQPPVPDTLLAALAAGDVDALAAALHNDLQAPALDLRPELGALIARGEEAGALRGLLSGSGPTCLFLCRDGDHAREVAAALDAGDPGDHPHPTVLVANGAVSGAHLVEYA
ncbi:4-(cytidine 5'-diphospho)-2-C-methyl-D-erythritol kinase [Nocardioides sp. zg-DK7169]|uniref:4-(cytidine 5'-diphospho)-2-C-methyl-D-erythritol kinase n=1 Tax=Nocardioides sp. zg-DK7169 TaxID=2736600 RepID=UPI0015523517|nr:4-(cytidine 5'-diphospho)-2-C-methyl-D-erythritol kinase [Nocardioides sp. zg-DK7169]NPC97400.1 4-(cytidine 5'-diphospho)-2-C-methyl-D-erythritol kinase [Nocardioides sp. zg-DK7169]